MNSGELSAVAGSSVSYIAPLWRMGERRKYVRNAINNTGPNVADERPNPPDPAFEKEIHDWMAARGVTDAQAVFSKILERFSGPDDEDARGVIDSLKGRDVSFADNPKDKWLQRLISVLRDDVLDVTHHTSASAEP
ncbi:MAG: hypothetical protein GY762_03845 [Proteobacteria bacterium]|nr:hypothetical protein [Pseudomonadota bacterium]